jgi:hypothetical protein
VIILKIVALLSTDPPMFLWIKWTVISLSVGVFLFAAHKTLLWMERRGWIYYQKKKAQPGTSASAWLELHQLVEPGKKHVLQIQREEHKEEDDQGGSL